MAFPFHGDGISNDVTALANNGWKVEGGKLTIQDFHRLLLDNIERGVLFELIHFNSCEGESPFLHRFPLLFDA
jgi:hypothetical protein